MSQKIWGPALMLAQSNLLGWMVEVTAFVAGPAEAAAACDAVPFRLLVRGNGFAPEEVLFSSALPCFPACLSSPAPAHKPRPGTLIIAQVYHTEI